MLDNEAIKKLAKAINLIDSHAYNMARIVLEEELLPILMQEDDTSSKRQPGEAKG